MEVLGESPWMVIDGAHNVASALALAETLRTSFPATPRTLVFGTSRDKDLHGPASSLASPIRHRDRHPVPRETPAPFHAEDVAAAIEALDGRKALDHSRSGRGPGPVPAG